MKIFLDREIPAPSDKVWRALTDPTQLKACIPGCRAFVRIDNARWGAIVALKIHTLQLEFSSRTEIVMAYPPEGFVFHFCLSHPVSGNVTGTARAKLIAGPEDEAPLTFLHYDIHMQASGLLANVDERLVKEIAYRWADVFFVHLTDALKAEEAEAAAFPSFSRFPIRFRKKSAAQGREKMFAPTNLAA